MASIVNDANGRKRILFVAPDGNRKAVRIGKASMKQAEAFNVKIEQLVAARITGVMDDETARWVAGLSLAMHDRLTAVGLITEQQRRRAVKLGPFLAEYRA